MHRAILDPRRGMGTVKMYQEGREMGPGDWSGWNFAPRNDPTRLEKQQQERLGWMISTYHTDGKVQVVPRDGPINMAGPPCWPPIPPAYVPRPGLLVPLPYQTSFQPDTQPQPQLYGSFPIIKQSGKVQRTWINNNPGVIDIRGLEDSPADAVTTYKATEAWQPIFQRR